MNKVEKDMSGETQNNDEDLQCEEGTDCGTRTGNVGKKMVNGYYSFQGSRSYIFINRNAF